MRVRSAFSTTFFRPCFDVAMPLLGRWHLDRDAPAWPMRRRPLLLSFKGSATDPGGLRARLAPALHNGRDVQVHVRSMASKVADPEYFRHRRRTTTTTTTTTTTKKRMRMRVRRRRRRRSAEEATAGDMSTLGWREDESSYGMELLRSRFALVPRGYGLHSHRLLEAMSAGSIPVLVADDYVLPFENPSTPPRGPPSPPSPPGDDHNDGDGRGSSYDDGHSPEPFGGECEQHWLPWEDMVIRVPESTFFVDGGEDNNRTGSGGVTPATHNSSSQSSTVAAAAATAPTGAQQEEHPLLRSLRAIPLERLEVMQRTIAAVYREHFSSTRNMSIAIFQALRRNVARAQRRSRAEQAKWY